MAFNRMGEGPSQTARFDGFLGAEQEFGEKGRRFLREEKSDIGLESLKGRG